MLSLFEINVYTIANCSCDIDHWMRAGENPPVGLILCSQKGSAEAHYALEGLSNKVLAAEYQTVLPSEAVIAKQLVHTTRLLAERNASKPAHGKKTVKGGSKGRV